MKLSITEQIMYSTIRIVRVNKSYKILGCATGFIYSFWNEVNKIYEPMLISNRHVFSNCDGIRMMLTLEDANGMPNHAKHEVIEIMNHHEETIYHPDSNVDLVAFPVKIIINNLSEMGVSWFFKTTSKSLIPSSDEWKSFDAVEDVIMVGYPHGMWDNVNNLPIFRKGITATPLAFNFQGTEEFLVDIACFNGYSGSPIFVVKQGAFTKKGDPTLYAGSDVKLVGILRGVQKYVDDVMLLSNKGNVKTGTMAKASMNLGYVIKSSELLDIEKFFNRSIR